MASKEMRMKKTISVSSSESFEQLIKVASGSLSIGIILFLEIKSAKKKKRMNCINDFI